MGSLSIMESLKGIGLGSKAVTASALMAMMLAGCGQAPQAIQAASPKNEQVEADLLGYKLDAFFKAKTDYRDGMARLSFSVKKTLTGASYAYQGTDAVMALGSNDELWGSFFLAKDNGIYFMVKRYSDRQPQWSYYGKYFKVGTYQLPGDADSKRSGRLDAKFDSALKSTMKLTLEGLPYFKFSLGKLPAPVDRIDFLPY